MTCSPHPRQATSGRESSLFATIEWGLARSHARRKKLSKVLFGPVVMADDPESGRTALVAEVRPAVIRDGNLSADHEQTDGHRGVGWESE